jgi:hypothetical protein
MDISAVKKTNRLSAWAQMVSECRYSGKTVAAWCTENGINEKTYYLGRKGVRCNAGAAHTAGLSGPANEVAVGFAEITPRINTGRIRKRQLRCGWVKRSPYSQRRARCGN